MNKFFTFLFLSAILLTGCSSDDDSSAIDPTQCFGSITASEIVGTWNYSSLFTDGTTVTTTPSQTFTSNVKVTSVSSTTVFTFNADGTFNSSGSMIVRDNLDGVDSPTTRELTQGANGSYEITATNDFIFSNVGGLGLTDTTFQVRRLDNGQFCLEANINETIGNPSNGAGQVSTGTSYLGFTK
ncbi:MAG: hypothetical protein ACI9WL_000806 [Rubritalea sp.]|jgi:hypothetical protein